MKGNLAVTGLASMDNPSPGLAVAKCLRESGRFRGRIIGLAFDILSTGIFARELWDEVYLIPPPAEGQGPLLERLREISRRTPLDVIMPTLDAEMVLYARARRDLEALGIRLLVPEEKQIKIRAKSALPEFARQHGFTVPRTMTLYGQAQLSSAIADLGFPFLLKGPFLDCRLVTSPEEAEVSFYRLEAAWGLPLVAQRYVQGEEYNVAALLDGQGAWIGAVMMKKIGLTSKGKAWAGVTIYDRNFLRLAQKILTRLEWVGPVELEFIKEGFSQKFYLIEINARFPSWIYLAARAGQNLPLAAYRLARGERLRPMNAYRTGTIFYRSVREYIAPFHLFQDLAAHGGLSYR
ncbi:MAG: ATP-grasp domain-containing protein [Deltaproteobacteria bacterium]|nr:ATP-grasp domain-containing protein [Deltaproteobacteria bacterium]